MKKILLSLFLSVFVSIGAWAEYWPSAGTWCQGDANISEKCVKLHLGASGELASAITAINADANYAGAKKIYINSNEGVYLNDADIQALSSLNYETIDLQDLNYETAFTFSNAHVKNLILPDGWTKDQVTACATGNLPNLGAAFSIGDYKDGKSINAYVKTPNTLKDAIIRSFMDDKPNTKICTQGNQYGFQISKVKSVSISGYPVARDFSGYSSGILFDENGHFEFDQASMEHSAEANMGINGTVRKLVGTEWVINANDGFKAGALYGATLERIDLEDAIIYDEYYEDLTLTSTMVCGAQTKIVIIPTCEELKTIPADFVNNLNGITEICIPSNITTIKTRAFHVNNLNHVWTTAHATLDPKEEKIIYDNGAVKVGTQYENSENAEKYYGYIDSGELWWGTYTLSSNLKLIESYAFSTVEPNVRDVYCLSVTAPECHVDAFNTMMYSGHNGFNGSPQDGMVTRDTYTNGGRWITMLHYPRESVTPEPQRYTDPQRRYSIATGMVDGKGGTIYFPTQAEFGRAYQQGTTGFTWNAFDPTRNGYGGFLYAAEDGVDYTFTNSAWSAANQNNANTLYNAYYNRSNGANTSNVFYETSGEGVTTLPINVTDYSTLKWQENSASPMKQLYPAPETASTYHYSYVEATETDFENGIIVYIKNGENFEPTPTWSSGTMYYKRIQTQVIENGTPSFISCDNGHYVKDFRYEEDPEGKFVRTQTGVEYKSTTTPVDGVTTYYDDQGAVATPKIADGYYFEDGEKKVWSDAVYNPQTVNGELVTEYYVKNSDGSYTLSPLYFNNAKWYNPKETTEPNLVSSKGQFVNDVDQWYDADGNEVTIDYTFPDWASSIYMLKDGEYIVMAGQKYEAGYTYYKLDNDVYKLLGQDKDGTVLEGGQFYWNQNYYYANGMITKTKCQSTTNEWIPTVSVYYNDENATSLLYDGTGAWPGGTFNGVYYYVTDTEPNYSSANGTFYNPSTTYYTDNTGSTEAETVNFDGTYFYTVNTYDYTEAEEGAEGTRYAKVEYYREAEEGETAETYYCPVMEDVKFYDVTKANDYRGWHQFVLVGTATNSGGDFVPYRSYMTDNDWWTICVPYDLTYNDIMYLFGDGYEVDRLMPHVCRLLYVIRDVDNGTITLNFSKNLMTQAYKASTTKNVYEEDAETEITGSSVVIEAGVPYMIRPNRKQPSNFSIDVPKDGEHQTLYENLYKLARNQIKGSVLKNMVEEGYYTVPAYTINDANNQEHSRSDAAVITYTKGNTEYDAYPNSNDYTFVGSFYNSLLPQYSYFLGWNPNTEKATFFYNDKHDSQNWRWANYTAIIMPNWTSATGHEGVFAVEKITDKDPAARWKVVGTDDNDDSFSESTASNRVDVQFDSESLTSIKGVTDIMPKDASLRVYTINGQYVGNTLKSLARGVYIVNGNKYIVK